MKVLLLGSSGFIGKSLASKIETLHQLVKVDRETNLEALFSSEMIYDFVVNCASSAPTAHSSQSHESNFKYPMQFFNQIKFEHWIQIDSYFQLQIPMGRNDPYSLDKQRFSTFLDAEANSRICPAIHHLFMPHVFGEGDRPGRLVSSAVSTFAMANTLESSSGSQFLPLLHISDAVSGIVKFIENPTATAACPPFWYGNVRELIELIASQFYEPRVIYGQRQDPIDARFPRVEFPQCVEGWQPKMQLNEFLEWVKVQSG